MGKERKKGGRPVIAESYEALLARLMREEKLTQHLPVKKPRTKKPRKP